MTPSTKLDANPQHGAAPCDVVASAYPAGAPKGTLCFQPTICATSAAPCDQTQLFLQPAALWSLPNPCTRHRPTYAMCVSVPWKQLLRCVSACSMRVDSPKSATLAATPRPSVPLLLSMMLRACGGHGGKGGRSCDTCAQLRTRG